MYGLEPADMIGSPAHPVAYPDPNSVRARYGQPKSPHRYGYVNGVGPPAGSPGGDAPLSQLPAYRGSRSPSPPAANDTEAGPDSRPRTPPPRGVPLAMFPSDGLHPSDSFHSVRSEAASAFTSPGRMPLASELLPSESVSSARSEAESVGRKGPKSTSESLLPPSPPSSHVGRLSYGGVSSPSRTNGANGGGVGSPSRSSGGAAHQPRQTFRSRTPNPTPIKGDLPLFPGGHPRSPKELSRNRSDVSPYNSGLIPIPGMMSDPDLHRAVSVRTPRSPFRSALSKTEDPLSQMSAASPVALSSPDHVPQPFPGPVPVPVFEPLLGPVPGAVAAPEPRAALAQAQTQQQLRRSSSSSPPLSEVQQAQQRLMEALSGPLTDAKLDQLLSTSKRLRLLAHSDPSADATSLAGFRRRDPSQPAVEALIQQAADKIVSEFLQVLEDQTQAVDVDKLCQGSRYWGGQVSEGAAAMGSWPELVGMVGPPPSPSVSQELPMGAFPGFHSAPQASDQGPMHGACSVSRTGASEGSFGTWEGSEVSERSRGVEDVVGGEDVMGAAQEAELADVTVPGGHADGSPQVIAGKDVVHRLRWLARAMVESGMEEQCLRGVKEARGRKLQKSLDALNVGPTREVDVVRMSTGELEACIKSWKGKGTALLRQVLAAERHLCTMVLDCSPWLGEQAYVHLGREACAALQAVADALTEGLKTEARLVLLLDLHEAVAELGPPMDEAFPAASCGSLRLMPKTLLQKIAGAVKRGFQRFEEFIETREGGDEAPPNCCYSRRSLLAYVMGLIKLLSSYKETLEQIFDKGQLKETFEALLTATERHVDRLSRSYEDPAQSEFFLMNCLRYMVCKVNILPILEVLGDRWIKRHRRLVQQHALAYQRIAWLPVMAVLDPSLAPAVSGNPGTGSAGSSPERHSHGAQGGGSAGGLLRRFLTNSPAEKLEAFTEAFSRLHAQHRCWLILDEELRAHMQTQVAQRLLDKYRPVVAQSKSQLAGLLSRRSRTHPTLTEETLQNLVLELYTGYTPDGID